MTDELLTIRQMCERFGVTARALRFYEARELLMPQRRGQHRLYDRRDRGRLKLILRGKRFGFSLEEIRHLLDLYAPADENRAQIAATLDTALQHLAEMQARRAELDSAIADLEAQIAAAGDWLPARGANDGGQDEGGQDEGGQNERAAGDESNGATAAAGNPLATANGPTPVVSTDPGRRGTALPERPASAGSPSLRAPAADRPSTAPSPDGQRAARTRSRPQSRAPSGDAP